MGQVGDLLEHFPEFGAVFCGQSGRDVAVAITEYLLRQEVATNPQMEGREARSSGG